MSLALRPSFSVDLDCPSRIVLERLFARLGAGPHQLRRTRVFGGERAAEAPAHDIFVLTVSEAEQHVWSPWLTVEVSPREGGASLFARFSPHPSVWTLFAFSYIALSAVLLFSLCFAAALAMSGGSPWALFASGGTALVMLALWWISQVGQRLARGQMEALRADLEGAIAVCAPAEAAPAVAAAPALS